MAESLVKLATGVGSLLFRQLQDADTGTFTYLLADPATAEAVLIDPVFERQHRDLALIRELGLQLVASLDTHVHADHVTASWCLHAASGCAIGLSAIAGAQPGRLTVIEAQADPRRMASRMSWPAPSDPMKAARQLCNSVKPKEAVAKLTW